MIIMVQRIIRLFLGLFLFAVGIVLTINANLGLAPWDVFHQGIVYLTGITMGQASIGVGIILVIINAALGERVGWGSLGNMLFIGLFMDLIMLNYLIPIAADLVSGLIMMFLGMFIVGVASYFYIGAGLGSGPRDGLMIALTKKTNRSVRFIRNSIEISALIVGYLLGGFVGIGTLIMSVALGYIIQFIFKLFRFNVKQVQHRFIDDDVRFLRQKFLKTKPTNETV
ncbi:putative membrane protein [Desulfosporosinus meridiei DSM 13257]|uniref:Putative membrane protein n=2 Tax=Desulfosporosinus TaxID=79206 RepID=J7IRW2_DESMD|nr:putative membrane protein [Desulfosporosinus meridiei DSM 13257]